MQSSFPKQVILFIAAASIGMSSLMAQTFSVLHSFDGTSGGRSPQAGLVASGNILYGAADSGGAGRRGTFFKLNMDGTGFATLHHFAPLLNETNSDGAYPDSTPVLSGNTIFGTAYDGGIYGHGTVFKMNTTGSDFSVLHHFVIRDVEGQSPLSLANAFQVTKGAMTNTLQRLEAKKYVTVEPDPADGRAKIVRITRAGRAARDRALAAIAPEIAGLLSEVKAAEFAAALPFLTKLKEVMDRRRD